jgi:hypothetical protein
MTVVNLTRTEWTQLNSAAKRLQVVGGPILVSNSNSPVANDWLTLHEGAILDVTANQFGQAAGTKPTWVVALDA